MSFANTSLTSFMQELASASPTPGGGSAAALAGALGASLVAMVCRLTIGRKNYAGVSSKFEELLPHADALRAELLDLMQQDADAYSDVMTAYRLPKETDAEQESRHAAIQSALRHAAEIPFRIATACGQVLTMSELAAAQGNKNAASDAGAGAIMAEAGLRAALLNVEINLGLIQDDAFNADMRERIEPLKQVAARRQVILDAVQTRL
jgi:formiminotetrahydrofolate cyclodeaminase